MAQAMPKRKIKDSVFTNLFQDKKYLLRLYQALHPEDSGVTEDDIKDVTIKFQDSLASLGARFGSAFADIFISESLRIPCGAYIRWEIESHY